MTSNQIESLAEMRMDNLDAAYLKGGLSHEEYNAGLDRIRAEYDRLMASRVSVGG